jgi:DNA-binding GntR family transcriptional regulator
VRWCPSGSRSLRSWGRFQEGRADTFVQTHTVGDFTDICADFFAKIGHTDLDKSRNSLREAFRLLAKEGLLRHEPNRGVFVATPSMASIIDIYRIRKIIECQALAKAYPKHPAVARMRGAVESARKASENSDWAAVGSQNMVFHASIVDLADSQRLSGFYAQIAAELRLSFGLLANPELLHAPYVEMNFAILETLEAGRAEEAAAALEAYLAQSERTVLAAFGRL